jgi:hypothetical protein
MILENYSKRELTNIYTLCENKKKIKRLGRDRRKRDWNE